MAIDFEPTESKQLFVGRQDEMAAFGRILGGQQPEWIIHLSGVGGIGKTRLLEQFRDIATGVEKTLVTTRLVDFYKVTNQAGFGLLQDIADQIGKERFSAFGAEREWFMSLLKTEPDPGERQEGVHRVTEAFLRDYQVLVEQGFRIVLLFDTCEEMHTAERFVLDSLLGGIHRVETQLIVQSAETEASEPHFRTTVVLAGRKRLEFSSELAHGTLILELPVLALEEIRKFFRQGGVGTEFVSDDALSQLHVATEGRPLYVALSFDWLKNGVGTVAELLVLGEPFGQKLVGWVRRLETVEKQTILYAALAWRRMEPRLLARLLGTDGAKAQTIIETLSRFSFVKYRPPSESDGFRGAFQLHDEMRFLINEYVWPQEGKKTQEALLPQLVDWYEQEIGDLNLLDWETRPPTDEERSLLAEYLYYQCQIDLKRAFELHERLFRPASHHLDLAFCDLINQEMERFASTFSAMQQDDLRFREALVAFRREQFEDASRFWYSLLRRPDLRESVRATTLMLLVELEGYTGRYDEALEHAAEGEEAYKQLLQSEVGIEQHDFWKAELGQLYNNWGYIYRVKGEWARALEFYEKALEYKERRKNIARTLNNMGYIYFLQGKPVKAKSVVGRALHIRKELGIPYELGLSYNTMGYFMEVDGRLKEAVDSYEKAKWEFDAARSERGRALVLLNLGRLERILNEYDKSIASLQAAGVTFEEKRDKDHLVAALNELGCAFRQRGNEGDWEAAEHNLGESLKLSRELGRRESEIENLEDLALLNYERSVRARERGNEESATEFARKAREAAEQVGALAREAGDEYRKAKNERTLGDLEYAEDKYEAAFGHYLEASRLMARAPAREKHSSAWNQRRYEEIVDRMQEQLHGLPKSEDTARYANLVLERYNALSPEEQTRLQLVKAFLEETVQMAQKPYFAG